jgi:large subunit ribosomal protein L11
VKIKVFPNETYKFVVKTPPTIQFIKAKISSQNILSSQALKEIAEIKLPDLNTEDLAKAQKTIAGTARSAGIKIEG